ncbi:hypothetical protein WKR88_14310 [Trinickia caryophylli]|nr:hypothetical protein [Trinickia caryophylli]
MNALWIAIADPTLTGKLQPRHLRPNAIAAFAFRSTPPDGAFSG